MNFPRLTSTSGYTFGGLQLLLIAPAVAAMVATWSALKLNTVAPIQAPTTPPCTPHLGPPPADIEPFPTTYAYLDYPQSDLIGCVSSDMLAKRIQVRWALGDAQAIREQSMATSYWPTTVMVIRATNKLLIAGKRRNGNTVVEQWSINKPSVVYPVGGGLPQIQLGTVEDITTLVDEATQGRDMVVRLLEKPGQPQVVLAQFYDSRSIYALDFSPVQTTCTLVASATGGPSVVAFPQSARPFRAWWSANHITEGYVLVFVDDEEQKSYVLRDTNRDGALDGQFVVTAADWIANNWHSASSYLP